MSNIFINMIGKSGQDFLNCYHAIYHWEVGQQRREGALHDVFKAYAPEFAGHTGGMSVTVGD